MVKTFIPVKPYIKRFLITRFGSPVNMDQRSYIGKHFHLLLNNGTHKNDKNLKLSNYTEKLEVLITQDVLLRHCHVLTPSSIAAFNTFMEEVIKDQMTVYIDGMKDCNMLMTRKKRITSHDSYEQFIHKFRFTDGSLTYDAVKKAWERYREKVLSPV